MNRIFHCLVAAVIVMVLTVSAAFSASIPSRPNNYVNDYAHMLTAAQAQLIDHSLKKLQDKTTDQVVVATFNHLDGQSLEDFSIKLAEQWKIGQKGKDNGVILLIIKDDHKIRIEVGYGLEGVLTDEVAGMIIRNNIAPYFKKKMYYQGITNGLSAIVNPLIKPAAIGLQPIASHPVSIGSRITMILGAVVVELIYGGGLLILFLLLLYVVISLLGNTLLSIYHYLSKSPVTSSTRWFGPHAFFQLTLIEFLKFVLLCFCSAFTSSRSLGGSSGGFGGGGGGGFGGGGASGGW